MSIPFSEWVNLSTAIAEAFNNPRDRRRHRPERERWRIAAATFADPLIETAPLHGGFTAKPYLVAHPEREIAEARGVTWRCEACRTATSFIGTRYLWTGPEAAHTAAHRHNAERHPRRWARSQNFSGQVALDEARRVTRWGADA